MGGLLIVRRCGRPARSPCSIHRWAHPSAIQQVRSELHPTSVYMAGWKKCCWKKYRWKKYPAWQRSVGKDLLAKMKGVRELETCFSGLHIFIFLSYTVLKYLSNFLKKTKKLDRRW